MTLSKSRAWPRQPPDDPVTGTKTPGFDRGRIRRSVPASGDLPRPKRAASPVSCRTTVEESMLQTRTGNDRSSGSYAAIAGRFTLDIYAGQVLGGDFALPSMQT
ncbi:MAG: hypothetical protein MJA29_00255 [Candidatus Omnitrophica bacterium]|nr:hypothetical protein [Candidatus Omnitrophota bacterium]